MHVTEMAAAGDVNAQALMGVFINAAEKNVKKAGSSGWFKNLIG